MPKSVLVCAAHPDDEVLGCGGTIARHVAEGDDVHVLFAADGITARTGLEDARSKLERRDLAWKATKQLGVPLIHFLNYPDQRLDTVPLLDIVKSIEAVIASTAPPNVVYTHHLGDLNLDHRLVAQAVLTAFRPLPGGTVEAIYGFETLSSTEWGLDPFTPTRFVAIDIDKKSAALEEYRSEMRDFPHARSYKNAVALAVLRGTTVGVGHAEAFTVLREIVR